jgi:hypothetical protein
LVVILVLAVVQVAVVLTERSRLESITWTAARSASVAASPTTAAQDVVTELVGDDADVRVDNDGRFVTVRVRRTIATDVPVVGRFFPDVSVETELTLLREPPLG